MASEGHVLVEVAYCLQDEQVLLAVAGDRGLTVRDAIERSGILKRFAEIDLNANKVGVFGKVAKLDRVLEAGDRVEIYRPLIADPKEQRRKRAQAGKTMRKGAAEGGDRGDSGT